MAGNGSSNGSGNNDKNSVFKPDLSNANANSNISNLAPPAAQPIIPSPTSVVPAPSPDTGGYDFDPNNFDTRWEQFRVPSQDQHGHAERIQTRIQPGHLRMIGNLVGAKIWGYRDPGDFIRHAIDRHIRYLESFNYPIPSVTVQVDAVMNLLRTHEYNMEYRTMFEMLHQQVQEYLQLNSPDEAKRLVIDTRTYLLDMPDGPWKKRYLDTIQQRFGYLAGPLELPESMEQNQDSGPGSGLAAGTPMSMDMFVPGLND